MASPPAGAALLRGAEDRDPPRRGGPRRRAQRIAHLPRAGRGAAAAPAARGFPSGLRQGCETPAHRPGDELKAPGPFRIGRTGPRGTRQAPRPDGSAPRAPLGASRSDAALTHRSSSPSPSMCAVRRCGCGDARDRPGDSQGGLQSTSAASPFARPTAARSRCAAVTSHSTTAVRPPMPFAAALERASSAMAGSISTSTSLASGARRPAMIPTAPVDAPRSTIGPGQPGGVVAASRTASVPALCPEAG